VALIGMTKELIKKKRVAGGTLDAARCESLIRGDQRLGKSAGIVRWQRTEIDCR
jgi:hypothetical protein